MIGGFTLVSESKRKWGNVAEDSLKYSEKGKNNTKTFFPPSPPRLLKTKNF